MTLQQIVDAIALYKELTTTGLALLGSLPADATHMACRAYSCVSASSAGMVVQSGPVSAWVTANHADRTEVKITDYRAGTNAETNLEIRQSGYGLIVTVQARIDGSYHAARCVADKNLRVQHCR